MLAFYWLLGKDNVRKQAEQKWGSNFFATLSMDLKTALPVRRVFQKQMSDS